MSLRDWVYLLSLLIPFVVYNLALKACEIALHPDARGDRDHRRLLLSLGVRHHVGLRHHRRVDPQVREDTVRTRLRCPNLGLDAPRGRSLLHDPRAHDRDARRRAATISGGWGLLNHSG